MAADEVIPFDEWIPQTDLPAESLPCSTGQFKSVKLSTEWKLFYMVPNLQSQVISLWFTYIGLIRNLSWSDLFLVLISSLEFQYTDICKHIRTISSCSYSFACYYSNFNSLLN
jgi:hypothetical protein